MTERKGPTWLRITLWTLGIAVLLILLYFHLSQGGSPGRHL
jgi:hypothetical protein